MTALRPARPSDRPCLLDLQSCLAEPSPTLLAHGLRTGGVLVATTDGGAVGYLLAVGVAFDDASESGDPSEYGVRTDAVDPANAGPTDVETNGNDRERGADRPSAHLAELVVAPAHRRQGHGSALLGALLARAGRVTVTVAPDNDAALALYHSRGFERVARRPDAFADGPGLVLATPT